MQSRNVNFLETPPYVLRLQDKAIDYTEQNAYIDDVIDHTSFLHPFISEILARHPGSSKRTFA